MWKDGCQCTQLPIALVEGMLMTNYNIYLTVSSLQVHQDQYPVDMHMARDFLTIPGAMVSVEQLFSRSQHLCTDQQSSLKATTLTQVMYMKEWLWEGLMKWD